ncbi:4Fe-4S double cluster binding domain-containing protein [Moorella stamsii]|nr:MULTISPECIES: reductive dehalogenase domain-containing protein [Moorella]
MDRRTFLKAMGLAGIVASVPEVALAAGAANIDPPYRTRASHGDEYRKVLPKAFYRTIENRPGYIGTTKIVGEIKPFEDAREHGFAQLVRRVAQKDWSGDWGAVIKEVVEEKAKLMAKFTPQQREDFLWSNAITMASDQWHVNLGPGRWESIPISKEKLELPPEIMTAKLKKVAKWYGIEQIGVCEIDESMRPFFYKIGRTQGTLRGGAPGFKDEGRPIPWPYPHKYCIVIGNFEDLQGTKANTGGLNNISVATECSDDDIYPLYLESIIRGLGYDARAQYIAGTEDFLQTPFAVKAGLGELGRNGQLVSPWGAHIRLAAVTTNMPLVPDRPIDFGLQEFCKTCKKCAENCPAGAISDANEPTNVNGTLRYEFDAKKCAKYRFVYGCATCAAVCPYSKPDNLVHSAGRVIGRNPAGARLLKTLDDFFYGRNPKPRDLERFAPWRL